MKTDRVYVIEGQLVTDCFLANVNNNHDNNLWRSKDESETVRINPEGKHGTMELSSI